MSKEANSKTLITDFVDCLNNKELDKIDELYSVQDTQYPHGSRQRPPQLDLVQRFPEGHYQTEHLLTDNDKVLWHWIYRNSSISFRGANMFRAQDGKIVEDYAVGPISLA
ncbi:MAG: hypothetical protein NVSMB44_35100 [Ktedonobacteraceae bacterium]